MTSTSFNVGINTSTRNSSKVLKPPGGGSSDIFGVTDAAEPQRGRRNHNISSFSLGGEEVATPARKPGNNSFYNLFGPNPSSESRPSTAAKDKFRSNIILDHDDTITMTKKTLFSEENSCTDIDVIESQNDNEQPNEIEQNGNDPLSEASQESIVESVSTNGSTSSSESTPAPTPTPSAAPAPAKQRVPPGGFSSGLW